MLNLETLKQEIENNKLTKHFIIFKCDKVNNFLPHQYAMKFCADNGFEVSHLTELSDFPTNGLFNIPTNELYLYKIETLDTELPIDQEEVATHHVWVVCNKISANVKKIYEDHIVELPKFEEWQIKDYIMSCGKVTEQQCDKLYTFYGKDLFRLSNELHKINLLGYNEVESQLYNDITSLNVFDLSNAIVRRDKQGLANVLKNIDFIDVDVFGLLSILITNFKHVIDIQLGKNATAESLGIPGKQFWAIQNYSCGYYNKQELTYLFELLNDFDYKIKSGEIDTSIIIDYIICKVISL